MHVNPRRDGKGMSKDALRHLEDEKHHPHDHEVEEDADPESE